MEIAVWLIAGFFALNASVLGTSVFLATNGRHRARREIRQLEAIWRLGSSTSERRRAWRLIALSAGAAFVVAAAALTIPAPGRFAESAHGPSMSPALAGGVTDTGRDEVRANRSATPSTSLADLAEGSPSGPADTASRVVPDHGSGQGQSTTPAFIVAEPRSSTVIRVSWARVAAATGYDLERSTQAGTGWVWVATTGDGVTAYTDTSLDPEETYFYRVVVILEDGASAPPSDVVSATTPVDPPEATVLQVTARSQTTIDLTWNDVANESGYRIERSADGETGWAAIGNTGQDITTYSDVGLEPRTTYFYRVVAVNEGGSAQPSNVVSETTKNGVGTDGTEVLDAGDGEQAGDGDITSPTTELSADGNPAAPQDGAEASGEAAG